MSEDKAFTLIELLIVIAIVGILASAILPRFTSFNLTARDAASRANLAALRGALIQYRGNEGDWPTSLNTLRPVYIEKIPNEFLSAATGCNIVADVTSDALFTGNRGSLSPGWVYGNYNSTGATTNYGRAIATRSTTQAGGSGSTANW